MRYQSQRQVFGLPLLSVAVGPDLAANQARGVARGIIAIGDIAIGGLAVGGAAFGIIPIGGMSLGIVAIGGLTLGIVALGGAAIGGIALGGLAIGVKAVGGLAIGVYADGGLAIGVYPEGDKVIRLFEASGSPPGRASEHGTRSATAVSARVWLRLGCVWCFVLPRSAHWRSRSIKDF